MARLFVTSDNLATRIEIVDPTGTSEYYTSCVGCGVDLVQDSRARFSIEDTIAVAEIHADRCQCCADPDCRTPGRHDAGHRCRKD